MIKLTVFLIAFLINQAIADFQTINKKSVVLKKTTYISLKFAPHLGTLIEFPFPKSEIENFGIEVINNQFFSNTSIRDLTELDNSFSISLNTPNYQLANQSRSNVTILSDIFIHYGKYKVIIRAKATGKPKEHTTHVVFKLSLKDQRTYTEKKIDEFKIKQKTLLAFERKKMEQEFSAELQNAVAQQFTQKLRVVDIDGDNETDFLYVELLNYIVLKDYTIYNFKSENTLDKSVTIQGISVNNTRATFSPLVLKSDTIKRGSFLINGKHRKKSRFKFTTNRGLINVR